MVDPSRNKNEGYKAYSEGNGKIKLKSALPKDWGLRRTLKGWKMIVFVNDTGKWSHCNGWPNQVRMMKMVKTKRWSCCDGRPAQMKNGEDGLLVMGDLLKWRMVKVVKTQKWPCCNGRPAQVKHVDGEDFMEWNIGLEISLSRICGRGLKNALKQGG